MFDNAWGALPVALPLLAFVSLRVARRVLPEAPRHQQWGAAVVLAMVLVHASVGVLGELGVLSGGSVLLLLGLAAAVASRWRDEGRVLDWRQVRWSLALGSGVMGAAALAARLLPVWQWDAHGYHLPFVNFVVQAHGFAGVPPDLRYISTYPHNIELGMIWLRTLLPDDRLVDGAQLPYGAAAAVLTAVIARELGASPRWASLAGSAWLTIPGVFLQLPTNYVDVGTAAALLGAVYFLVLVPVSRPSLVIGALALGIFLGSKPSAPVAALVLGTLAAVRAVRAGQARSVPLVALLTLVFGGEMYLLMTLRHGNPIWPVALKLGPVTLPGDFTVDELLAAGAATPRVYGSLAERLSVSWLALDSLPVFDMRLGGFGLLALVCLPLAIAGVVRRRSVWLVLGLVVTLLSPDPSVARYVLAFPGLLLAIAFVEASRWPRMPQHFAAAAVFVASVWQVSHAWPGLSGDGPPLMSLLALDDDMRRVAVGPFGRPDDYPRAWALVREGESVAFDIDFEFPGLLWNPTLSAPVLAVPPDASSEWLESAHVRVLAVGRANRRLVEGSPRWRRLFSCRSADCAVYARVDAVATHD